MYLLIYIYIYILEQLEQRDFSVNLKRISDLEMVVFAFEGLVVFSCNIRYLTFDGCTRNLLNDRILKKMLALRENATLKMRDLLNSKSF